MAKMQAEQGVRTGLDSGLRPRPTHRGWQTARQWRLYGFSLRCGMFITQDMNPGEMLAELLRGRRVRPEATSRLARLKHNNDLCPKLTERVSAMLEVYRSYNQEVHDIQGFHDNGVDILLKYETRDGNVRRAGIQIKSESEFRDWEAKRLDMIKTLKSQYSEAFEDARVHEYYIVLCVDAVRHQERIRTLNAKMMNYKNCSIIEPIDILDLLEADNLAVTRRVTRLLCQNDRVLNGAIEALNAEDVDVAFFIITLMCQAFDGDLLVSQVRLKEIWTEWEDFAKDRAGSDERLMLVLSALDTAGALSDDGDGWSINVDQLPTALCALYFDQKFRIRDANADLADYLVGMIQGLSGTFADHREYRLNH